MSSSNLCFLLCVSLLTPLLSRPATVAADPSPYLSPPAIFLSNYQNMLITFKIYIYSSQNAVVLKSPAASLFHSSLLGSPFVTQNPNEAHMFFVPFNSDLSTRSVIRLIKDLKAQLPFWNRTLGADHFFVSCSGIGYESDRNLVELKKNSIQISPFPAPAGKFIPHKDITLPPLNTAALTAPHALPQNTAAEHLAFAQHGSIKAPTLVNGMIKDIDFFVESEPSDPITYESRLRNSKFCVFDYDGDVSAIGDAMGRGCVPAVITDRPIQDLPFIDVLTWREIAVFAGKDGGVEELKRVLSSVGADRYERMRLSGASASRYLAWNAVPQPFDSFYTLIYQLWLRRHTIRYGRHELDETPWKM